MSNQLQDFYKSTISQDWSIGTGNFYLSVKPTTAPGRLVISPSSDTLREIVEYTSTGTDANGDYIVISTRGVGGTTEQAHTVGEKIRMNITAEDWEDMRDDIDSIVAAGAPDASTTTRGIVEIATDAEVIAGTDTGSTGAKLVATPSQLKDFISPVIETTSGTTHSLTTIAGQKVIVLVKGYTSQKYVNQNSTISLNYDGTLKDSVKATTGENSTYEFPFSLMYTDTPGAGTKNITVTSNNGASLNNVVIIVIKIY